MCALLVEAYSIAVEISHQQSGSSNYYQHKKRDTFNMCTHIFNVGLFCKKFSLLRGFLTKRSIFVCSSFAKEPHKKRVLSAHSPFFDFGFIRMGW